MSKNNPNIFDKIDFRLRRYKINIFYGKTKNKYDPDGENIVPNHNFNSDLKNKKIVVYTCITGKYDQVKDPEYINDNVDYFIITNNPEINSSVWKIMEVPNNIKDKDNIYINRYVKLHPNEIFPAYDYSIYVDGSVLIVDDIIPLIKNINPNYGLSIHRHSYRNCVYQEFKECLFGKKGNKKAILKQVRRYKKEGFPQEYGLLECPLLFTQIGQNSKAIYDNWWDEFIKSNSYRDQLSLPYVLWKMGIRVDDIATLGTNIRTAKTFKVLEHK